MSTHNLFSLTVRYQTSGIADRPTAAGLGTFSNDDDDDDEFVFAREVQFPHGAYKEKEKTKRKGTKETITKGHTQKKIYGTCLVKAFL